MKKITNMTKEELLNEYTKLGQKMFKLSLEIVEKCGNVFDNEVALEKYLVSDEYVRTCVRTSNLKARQNLVEKELVKRRCGYDAMKANLKIQEEQLNEIPD